MMNDGTLKTIQIKKIFSRQVAYQLQERGFWMIGTEPNLKKPQFKVFLFEATPEMLEAYKEILQNR